jgi:hypothetical protein
MINSSVQICNQMEINVMSSVDQVSEIIEHGTFNRELFVTNYVAHIPFSYIH